MPQSESTLLELPYGRTVQRAVVPAGYDVTFIAPREVPPADNPLAVVEAALASPIGHVRLADFRGAESAAIAINDKTRPVPHAQLLPPLLRELEALGISHERITLVIATGTHPVMPPEEYSMILPPEIIARYPIVCHDALDDASLVALGTTKRGTPVFINRHYMASDLRLVIGNVEPHQFMGFSGGVKSAAIGLAGKVTVNHNHALMTDDHARLGAYGKNPARQDVEEIGARIRVDFALNAVLNGQKQIVEAFAGDPVALMQVAMPRVTEIFQVPVAAPFDLLITSPGGHPKDINLYQSQKALAHAALITRPGGGIILCAACPEGTGSTSYETWLHEGRFTSHEAVIEQFQSEGFRVGPHKAFQISRDAVGRQVWLISEMPPAFVSSLLLQAAPDLQHALEAALADLPVGARIGVMPAANATIPALLNSGD